MTDLEDAVKRLDNLTQEEARMVLAELLKITHNVRDDVKVVIEGARGVSNQSPMPSDIHTLRRQRVKSGGEGNKFDYSADSKQRRRNQVFVIACPHSYFLLALIPIHRESVNTAPTSVALSRRSVDKSQHRTKSSARRNGGLVLSRQHLHRVEVDWLTLVDTRKTCASVNIIRAHAF